mmetsp:Transcript_36168/g.87490  ORF Transcript_36168/g.87490 Transcript_36168/m.87490 type:complete len:344 (+) Transcript_36168:1816-2847(+)
MRASSQHFEGSNLILESGFSSIFHFGNDDFLDGVRFLGTLVFTTIDKGITSLSEFFPNFVEIFKWLSRETVFDETFLSRFLLFGNLVLGIFVLAFLQVFGKAIVQLFDTICRNERSNTRSQFSLSFQQVCQFLDIQLSFFHFRVSLDDPIALECIVGGDTFLGIDRQHSGNQFLGARTDPIKKLGLELKVSITSEIKDNFIVLIIKGKVSTNEQKEQTPCRPNIAFGIIGRESLQHFGSQISRSSAKCTAFILSLDIHGKGEISQFDSVQILVLTEQQVLGFDISMGHSLIVHISQSIQDTTSRSPGFGFCKGFLFNDIFQQFTTLHEFHNQVTKGSFFINFI